MSQSIRNSEGNVHMTQLRRAMALLRNTSLAMLIAIIVPAHGQGFDNFDAAVVLKKSVWSNLVATVLPMANVSFPSGKVSLVDGVLCEISTEKARFLVAFKVSEAHPYNVISENDCSKSVDDIVKDKTQLTYDGLAYVIANSKGERLRLSTAEVTVRNGATVSQSLLQDIQSYDAVVERQSVTVGEGSLPDHIDLTLNFVNGGLVVKAWHPAMSHSLNQGDVPDSFVVSTNTANTAVVISHNAIAKIVETHLRDKLLPIEGTNAKFKVESYSGGYDEVTVDASITDAGLTFAGSATWSGPELRLSAYSVRSTKDCSTGNALEKNLCNLAREVETKAAEALALVAWQKYKSAKMSPLTRADKIKFKIYEKAAYFAGRTIFTTANENRLMIGLDSYIGIER
jgi:hypothetical protein